MKKLFPLFLMAIAIVYFTSCGGSDDDDTNTPESYITFKQLQGSWQRSVSGQMGTVVEVLTFKSEQSFSYVRDYTFSDGTTNRQTGEGLYSLRRADQHYIGFAYDKQVVANDNYEYVTFEWQDAARTKFLMDGTLCTKQ